ncbi:MAG: adenosine kinase [Pseudomonadota bacterium]
MTKSLTVYGVGNALVDMAISVEDDFLVEHDVARGLMTLVDGDRMAALVAAVSDYPSGRGAGGSAANTIYAVQGFGGRGGYGCRVADDDTGRYFLADMRSAGIRVSDAPLPPGMSGRCLVLTTPDGERSMSTYLGASSEIAPDCLDLDAIADAATVYIEGYLCAADNSVEVGKRAREAAEQAGAATALTLSDPSMVAAFKDNLLAMIGPGLDHLFCNEEEALTWCGTDSVQVAANELKDLARNVNITLGAQGSLAISPDGQAQVAGFEADVVDTNGAGDIYAGAVLQSRDQGASAADAARFANFCAANLISRVGPRLPDTQAYAQLKQAFSKAN